MDVREMANNYLNLLRNQLEQAKQQLVEHQNYISQLEQQIAAGEAALKQSYNDSTTTQETVAVPNPFQQQ